MIHPKVHAEGQRLAPRWKRRWRGAGGDDDQRPLVVGQPEEGQYRLRGRQRSRRWAAKAAPFVGVLGAMLNKSTPNKDVAVEFIEEPAQGLKMINDDVPLGTPAKQDTVRRAEELDPNPGHHGLGAGQLADAEQPEMGRFWSAMVSALGNITDGRQSPRKRWTARPSASAK